MGIVETFSAKGKVHVPSSYEFQITAYDSPEGVAGIGTAVFANGLELLHLLS